MKALHDDVTAGHLGMKKTIDKVKQRYEWHGMTADIRAWCQQCVPCAKRSTLPKRHRAGLLTYNVGYPMERVAIDVLGPLTKTPRGNTVILIVADLFTKWIEAYPLPNQEAETVARTIVTEFIVRYGVPRILHSDQGRNFESKLTAEVCKLLGMDKTRTCPYRPQANGFVERANKTILDMLAKTIRPDQEDWDLMLPMAMMAYRSSVQETIQETPNMMMLGREVTLPIDLTMLTRPPEGEALNTEYAKKLRENLQSAHEAARKKQSGASRRMKKNYSVKTRGQPLVRGDFVWLFDPTKKKGLSPKLQNRWMGPYVVIKKLSDVVYRIQLKKNSKMKVVHFDRLKCYNGPSLESWIAEDEQEEVAAIVEGEEATILERGDALLPPGILNNGEIEENLENNRRLTSDDPGLESESGENPEKDTVEKEEIIRGVQTRGRKKKIDEIGALRRQRAGNNDTRFNAVEKAEVRMGRGIDTQRDRKEETSARRGPIGRKAAEATRDSVRRNASRLKLRPKRYLQGW